MNSVTVIFGANGFLGRYLSRYHTRQGREVVCVARRREGWSGDGMFLEWDGRSPGPWSLALEGADTVINLTGRSVDCRYTVKHRKEIMDSRVESTRVIGQAIAACRVAPKTWLNASTATWYRYAEDGPQNEWTGEAGEGFSHQVARAWEESFFAAPVPAETRKVAMRIGMVLANEPGTVFDVLRKLTTWGLGGAMGGGAQRVSWIHMEDFLRAVDALAGDPFVSNVVNVTSPDCPTNAEWMRVFRDVIGMPVGLPATDAMLKIGARMLRTETELVTKSRWVAPACLKDGGFRWRHERVADAVADLQARRGLEGFFRPQGSRKIVAIATPPKHPQGLAKSRIRVCRAQSVGRQ